MKYEKDLVSVVMPTYKRSEKLERAIDSVLRQTYSNLELIVVNDNNPNDDFSKELYKRVKKYEKDKRFKLINQKTHINGAVARNVGIKCARGEYIAFLDDDDWWKDDKLLKQVNALSNLDNTWGVVSCLIEQYDNDILVSKMPKYKDGYVYKSILLLESDYATGTLLFKHSLLDECGYFDENLLRHQDLQLLVNFTYKYKLFQVQEYLHCCDISDTQNRPNVEKIIKAKHAFFKSVLPVINSLSFFEKRQVYLLHNAEIGYVELKNRKFIKGLIRFIPLCTSIKAMYIELKKLFNKIKSKKNNKG